MCLYTKICTTSPVMVVARHSVSAFGQAWNSRYCIPKRMQGNEPKLCSFADRCGPHSICLTSFTESNGFCWVCCCSKKLHLEAKPISGDEIV